MLLLKTICLKFSDNSLIWWRVTMILGEGNGNPLQYSCLENHVDREAWCATVHGVTQSRTWLKQFSMHACIEGNGSPLQYSCLDNPRDEGAWWAAIYGVAHSRTGLKWLSSSSSSSNNDTWVCFVAQLTKSLLAMWETCVWSLGWEDPLEKGKATHSSILAWGIPWTCKESDTTERLSLFQQWYL